jgi:hypothetical protein
MALGVPHILHDLALARGGVQPHLVDEAEHRLDLAPRLVAARGAHYEW